MKDLALAQSLIGDSAGQAESESQLERLPCEDDSECSGVDATDEEEGTQGLSDDSDVDIDASFFCTIYYF